MFQIITFEISWLFFFLLIWLNLSVVWFFIAYEKLWNKAVIECNSKCDIQIGCFFFVSGTRISLAETFSGIAYWVKLNYKVLYPQISLIKTAIAAL